jgi:hypothetical protein
MGNVWEIGGILCEYWMFMKPISAWLIINSYMVNIFVPVNTYSSSNDSDGHDESKSFLFTLH